MNITKEEVMERLAESKPIFEKIFSKLETMHDTINDIDKETALSKKDIKELKKINAVPRWVFTWTVFILVGVASGFGTHVIGRIHENQDNIAQVKLNSQSINHISSRVDDISEFFSNYILREE